jgi:transposase
MAIAQLRRDTPGRAYYRRKLAAGKTPMEAMRCLKRRLSDAVYRQLVADTAADAVADTAADTAANAVADTAARPPAHHHQATTDAADTPPATDPGGQPGATTDSSAADSNPDVDASEKSLPGPATPNLRRPRRPLKTSI